MALEQPSTSASSSERSEDSSVYHLFVNNVPPQLAREDAQAAVIEQLSKLVEAFPVAVCSIIPQNNFKNKGFGFVTLGGSPSLDQVAEVARALEGKLIIGTRVLGVRPCHKEQQQGSPSRTSSGSSTGGSGAPSQSAGQTGSRDAAGPGRPGGGAAGPASTSGAWDASKEHYVRACALVFHSYFKLHPHRTQYSMEKLINVLRRAVLATKGGVSKTISSWGRETYGSLEAMLLDIGQAHFGGGWRIEHTAASKRPTVTLCGARQMLGWQASAAANLLDSLPRLPLQRSVSADFQRTQAGFSSGESTSSSDSGLATPAHSLRRMASDCSSLSHCARSEASGWSSQLHSSRCGQPSTATSLSLDMGASTPSGSTAPAPSSACDIASCSHSCKAPLRQRGARGGGKGGGAQQQQQQQQQKHWRKVLRSMGGHSRAAGSISPGRGRRRSGSWGVPASVALCGPGPPALPLLPYRLHALHRGVKLRGAGKVGHMTWTAGGAPNLPRVVVPPTANSLLMMCAQHLQHLFACHPSQLSFPVDYIADFLCMSPDLVMWGNDSPYFSFRGYAQAVYGSFEGLLLEVSRSHFCGSWWIGLQSGVTHLFLACTPAPLLPPPACIPCVL